MIVLYTGKLGCGKSYSATKKAWKFVKEGKTVYANFKIDFTEYYKKKARNPLWRLYNPKWRFGKVYYWSTLKDLSEIRNGERYFRQFPEFNDITNMWNGVRSRVLKLATDSGLYDEEYAQELLNVIHFF